MISLVNWSTTLPIDTASREVFSQIVNPTNIAHHDIVVLLVSRSELDDTRERIEDDGDLLGLYLSGDPRRGGRPLILVSPDKIFEAAVEAAAKHNMPLDQCHQAYLMQVILHEIGHWEMDHRAFSYRDVPWQWLANHEKGTPLAAAMRHLKQGLCPAYNPDAQPKDRTLVEESLAEAFTLTHRLPPSYLRLYTELIKEAPPNYRQGLLWASLDHASLLSSMRSWRCIKQRWGRFCRWPDATASCNGAETNLTERTNELKNSAPINTALLCNIST